MEENTWRHLSKKRKIISHNKFLLILIFPWKIFRFEYLLPTWKCNDRSVEPIDYRTTLASREEEEGREESIYQLIISSLDIP